MATKKNTTTKPANEKSTMIKIAEKVGEIAGEISVKKDQLVDMTTGAIESVKEKLHKITAPKKPAVKKAVKAVKKVARKAKPAAKRVKKAAVKKAATVKKAVKKVVKKAAPAKKAIKKAVKKATKRRR